MRSSTFPWQWTMPGCGFVFCSKHMQENVTIVAQQMQHLCLTAEHSRTFISFISFTGPLGGKIYDCSLQCDRLRTLGAAISHISVCACASVDPFAELKLNQQCKQSCTLVSLNSLVPIVSFYF